MMATKKYTARKTRISKGRTEIPAGWNTSLDYVRAFDSLNHFKAADYVWAPSDAEGK
jgi:hypothetical protein